MDIDIKIYIKDDDGNPFYGKGPNTLLKKIRETGSIKKAAESMNMSYSKAHAMVKKIEGEMGGDILIKEIGGKTGGGTRLTERAQNLIEEYEKFDKKLHILAGKEFKNFRKK